MARDLLLEIGVEELPSSFVATALASMPKLLRKRLGALRLACGEVEAIGTPRRLAVIAHEVGEAQEDLDEEVVGPPERVAFDADGNPTRAAVAFARKLDCDVESLSTKRTDKGEYLVGRRQQRGRAATELLPGELAALCADIPFKKSMRWADGDTAFGRPVRWLVALFGADLLAVEFAGVHAGRSSHGHRFLAPSEITISEPSNYVDRLRSAHVVVDPDDRAALMMERLKDGAAKANGTLIEDDFLVSENLSLVEEPHVVVGTFDESFLSLPERVILDVAKGHQRYFGIRGAGGALLPKYLAVVNTAESPEKIRLGNDRVMRARLADAKFFYEEDLKRPLAGRLSELDKIVFQKRLGTVGAKVRRLVELSEALGRSLDLSTEVVDRAKCGAKLAKCDLLTLMVGELPELQGEMGRAYALAQGVEPAVAQVISEHYLPRGADDPPAASDAGALVALADRLDTLTGCFAIGLTPTGATDPLALRRAAIGTLKTLLAKEWDLRLDEAIDASYETFSSVKLDLSRDDARTKLVGFFHQRLRGVLTDRLPADAVDACLAAEAARPHDARLRAEALGAMDEEARRVVGEVFKRAANIARDAPEGVAVAPETVSGEVHPSERALFDAYFRLRDRLAAATQSGDYPAAIEAVADFAPTLGEFFDDVFVMVGEVAVRENRLRVMREIHHTCSGLANFNLLAARAQ